MNRSIQVYNAFSGLPPGERQTLIRFFCEHGNDATPGAVTEAIDYALKTKPSFGGFVLASYEGNQLLAALVVNKTGMSGFSPEYLLVFAGLHSERPDEEKTLEELILRAIDFTNGDIALHLKPNSPILKVFKRMGFKTPYVELRFAAAPKAASA